MNRAPPAQQMFPTWCNSMRTKRMSPSRLFARFPPLGCALAALAVLVLGCGQQGPERVPVSGTVTWNGEPLPSAEHRPSRIYFVPAQGNEAPSTSAEIVNGEYTIESNGGVPVGKHRVRIEAYRPPPGSAAAEGQELPAWVADDVEGPPVIQFIPPRYNQRSELEIIIDPAGGPIQHNFDLSE